MTYRSRKRNIVPEKFAELLVQACGLEANRKDDHIFELRDLQLNKLIRLNTSLGSSVRCECGDDSNAGGLVSSSLKSLIEID